MPDMAFILFALIVAFAVMLLFGGLEMDSALLLVLYAGDHPALISAARIATWLGGWEVLIPATLAGAGWLFYRGLWRDAVLLLSMTLSGRLLVELLKAWTDRLRPEAHEHLAAVQSLSFPSGHSANPTMVYLGLALLVAPPGRWRAVAVWFAVWLALASGISRILLGVHWPSDVIGGWALGLVWLILLFGLAGHPIDDGLPVRKRRSPWAA